MVTAGKQQAMQRVAAAMATNTARGRVAFASLLYITSPFRLRFLAGSAENGE